MPRHGRLGKLLTLVDLLVDHEDAVEGSFLRYGLGDLADLYRGRMSLRQVWVRIQALPDDAPLWNAVRVEHELAEERRKLHDLDNVLDMFKPKEG